MSGPVRLEDLHGSGASDGDVPVWDNTAGLWVPTASASATALDDLSDVDTTGLSDGDVLTYNSTSGLWVPAAPTGGGGGGSSSAYRPLLGTLHATYGDDFTAATLDAKWSRGGNALSSQESFQVDPAPTWMRWTRTSTAGGYLYQTAPAGDFAVVIRCTQLSPTASMMGPLIADSSGNGVACIAYTTPTGYYAAGITAAAYNSTSTTKKTDGNVWTDGLSMWMRLRKSGTDYFATISLDGEKWHPETTAKSFATTPTRIGFGHIFNGTPDGPIYDIDVFNVE